jgi:hypothetical protein
MAKDKKKSTTQIGGKSIRYPSLVPIQAADVGERIKDHHQKNAARHANDLFNLFRRTRNKEKKKFLTVARTL